MGFLRRVFGGPSPQLVEFPVWILKPDRADAIINVVGEGFHQDALLVISGGRTPRGPFERGHVAVLFPEPDNKYDPNAIAVRLDGLAVGYLPRAAAYQPVIEYAISKGRKIACNAELTGGRYEGPRDKGSFGVKLRLGSPMECMIECSDNSDDALQVRRDHPWVGQLVAFTGTPRCMFGGMEIDRPVAEMLATRAGMNVHPRVTKHVRLLVDFNPSTSSENERKALDYGVPVVPELEFWTAIGVPVTFPGGSRGAPQGRPKRRSRSHQSRGSPPASRTGHAVEGRSP